MDGVSAGVLVRAAACPGRGAPGPLPVNRSASAPWVRVGRAGVRSAAPGQRDQPQLAAACRLTSLMRSLPWLTVREMVARMVLSSAAERSHFAWAS